MSLINDMLKDLEARGGGTANTNVRVTLPRRRMSQRWPLVVLALLVLVLAAALAMVLRSPREANTSVAATSVAATAVAAPPERAVVSEEIAPVLAEAATDTPPVTAPAAQTSAPVIEPVEPPQPAATTEKNPPVAREAQTATAQPEPAPPESVVVRRHEPTAAEKSARAAREGFAALRRGDWTSAARLLQELLAVEPANDDAREGLVLALTQQGRIAEADGALLDGLAVGAAPARFAKLRARTLAARGELDAALDSLAIAVPPVAADVEYHALKGALAQQAGRYRLAADIYGALSAHEPANGTWFAGLGMAFDGLADFSAARAAYERAHAAGRLDGALGAHVERRLAALTNE